LYPFVKHTLPTLEGVCLGIAIVFEMLVNLALAISRLSIA